MGSSANRSSVVPVVGCLKKRLSSSTNGYKKKIRSTSRRHESLRVLESDHVGSERSSSGGFKSAVCVSSATVDVRQSNDPGQVRNNPAVPVEMPNEGKMKDCMVGEEFGDLLARLNCVGPSMQHRLKQCEESIVSKDEEILKLKNELQEEKAKNFKLLRVADECQQQVNDCDVEKESALLREKLLTCELDVLKSKYVEKDKRNGFLQRELETVNKAGRARHGELEEEIMSLRETVALLNARNATLREVIGELSHDRRWLVTEGFSYVFDKLRKSVEFLRPYGIVRSLLLQSKFQDGLRVGHDLCSHGLGVDTVPGYDPDIDWKLNVAMDDLDALVFPYLRHLAANADKSLDVIRAIVPDSGYAYAS